MYNINVNLATTAATNPVNNLLVESICTTTTPRTPEILNSLIAMTNPLDNYNFGGDGGDQQLLNNNDKILTRAQTTTICASSSGDSNSSSSSQLESPTTNPPSVQHTCSQLIKAGLKLTIEQKRKHQNDGEDLLDLDKVKRIKNEQQQSESEEDKVRQECGIQNSIWPWYESDDNNSKLTPEDEERRRRRRERNKIAATKCRLKKRERTQNLVQESETLETQNIDLKSQLQELQNQKHALMELLSVHRPQCQHNIGPATRDAIYRLPPVSSVMENHSYSRPASVDPNFRTQNTLEVYNRPASVAVPSYTRPTTLHFTAKTPNIIVEEIDQYDPHDQNDPYDSNSDPFQHYTNLDAANEIVNNFNSYNTSQCHNYGTNYTNSQGLDNGCMA